MKIIDKNTIKLCCKDNGCPVLTLDGKILKITDDFGGRVSLSKDEARLLRKAIKKLIND